MGSLGVASASSTSCITRTNKQTSTLAKALTRDGFFGRGLCLQHLLYYTDQQTNNHTSKHTNTLTRDGFFGCGLCLQHLVEQQFQHVREVGQLCAASRQLQGVHTQTAQTPHSLPQHSDRYCLLLSVRLTPVKAYTYCMHRLVLRYKTCITAARQPFTYNGKHTQMTQ